MTQRSFKNQASLTLSSCGSWVDDSASHCLFLPGSGLWTGSSLAKLEEPAIPAIFCLVQGGYGCNLCLSPGVLGGITLKHVFSPPEVLTWQNISLEVVRTTSSLLGSSYLRMKPKPGEEHQNMERRGFMAIVFEYLGLAVLPMIK